MSDITARKYPSTPAPQEEVETVTATEVDENSFVYVHCYLRNSLKDMMVRIWKTTYLIDHTSSHRSELVHAENITFAPTWTRLPDNRTYSFLLIFSALPKSCIQFDLVEEITQPGGFVVQNIVRNSTDVYHVEL